MDLVFDKYSYLPDGGPTSDTYFGGGKWVIKQAANELELPEQTTNGVQDLTMVKPWEARWGPVATPLLSSHAMYLILSEAAPS